MCVHCGCKRTSKCMVTLRVQFKQNHPLHTIQYQPITTTADNHQPSIINTHTIHNYNTRQQNYTHSCLCCAEKRMRNSHNNKSIQQRRPPINSDHYYHHNTRPGMNALLTRQIIIIKSHITKPDYATKFRNHNNQSNHPQKDHHQ